MKIKLINTKFEDKWDYQRAKLLLEMDGLSGGVLNNEQRKEFKKEITLFLWGEIKKYFPEIEKFCTSKSGMINKIEEDHFNTPIVCIHGLFYMQYIRKSNRDEWSWDSINLDPYRFYFNEYNYLKNLFEKVEKEAISEGYPARDLSKNIKSEVEGE
jgi:hypothetical protein